MKQKFRTYFYTCYVLTKSFYEISTCHVACVKRKKINTKNKVFYNINFLSFT
jgi:hypothetical protein